MHYISITCEKDITCELRLIFICDPLFNNQQLGSIICGLLVTNEWLKIRHLCFTGYKCFTNNQWFKRGLVKSVVVLSFYMKHGVSACTSMVQALSSVDVDWSAANVLLGKMPNSRKLKKTTEHKKWGYVCNHKWYFSKKQRNDMFSLY